MRDSQLWHEGGYKYVFDMIKSYLEKQQISDNEKKQNPFFKGWENLAGKGQDTLTFVLILIDLINKSARLAKCFEKFISFFSSSS